MRVVVITGSRMGWPRPKEIENIVADLNDGDPDNRLLVGDAAGVDAIAFEAAKRHGVSGARFVAHWGTLGSKAGPQRNQRIVDRAVKLRDDMNATVECHAFPAHGQSRGTRDCIRRLEKAGFKVKVHEP